MRSFEAEPDVDAMLEDAQQNFKVPVAEVCNTALRKHGKQVIQEILAGRSDVRKWIYRDHCQPENIKPTAKTSELLKKTFKSKG